MSARASVSAVLRALDGGATSLDQVAVDLGTTREMVQVAVDQLVRLGRLDAKEIARGCPGGGCGTCASGTSDGHAGCGADGPSSARTGPVLVQLSVRRP